MKKYLNRIKNYRSLHSAGETMYWLYSCVKFKLRCLIRQKWKQKDFSYDKKIQKNFIKKDGMRVFIFATVPFYDIGGGQRSSQFAKIYNKLGYEVFYIYGFPCLDNIIYNIENPCVLHRYIKDVGAEYIESYVREGDLFIFEAPFVDFVPYLELAKAKKAKSVYENIDNWENSELGEEIFSEKALEKFVTGCDLLTSTAVLLKEQTEKYCKKYGVEKEVLYNANAVDDELFNGRKEYERPYDMVLGTKTLTYYGSLWGTWFNWDLVYEIADKNPRVSINLIGDYSGIRDIVSNSPSNIHYLGLKSQAELPAYLSYSDFAILPFYNDDIGKYVSPLKIFEYISMNKKVISCSLSDIKDYPNVYYADTFEEWNRILHDDAEPDEEAAENFVRENNWYKRSSDILDRLYPENAEKCNEKFYDNLSVVVLNYNNKKVIFRCVDTLIKFSERYNYEIIVVDNNSKDGSYERLMSEYDGKNNVKVLRNSKNGCSSGRNLGCSAVTKEYIMFLDSDEWITNRYWADNYFKLVEKLGRKTVVGWGAGWFNRKKFAYRVVDSFPHRYLPPQYLATTDIGYLATCGFIINKAFFDEIGGFDLNYDPTCYEDTDLSLNARHHGGEIYYCKYLGVGHLPHQTTKSGTKAHDELIHKKGEYFIKKWVAIDRTLITKWIMK